MMHFGVRCAFALACLALLASCESARTPAHSGSGVALPTPAEQAPRDFDGLHNVVAYHDGFVSGSAPEATSGFETLAAMGVRTIISVDGAVPDLDAAKSRGMRYVHLPIGYDGFDEQRKLELVRATRDAMRVGPVYIHCHHGKHRSAGAAGAIIASLGWATAEDMVKRMKVSGTSPAYEGLYACTAAAIVISPQAIEAVEPDSPEVSRPQGIVKCMVELDEINERLKVIASSQWSTPAMHPDLVPVAEAGRMADILRVLAQDESLRSEPAAFHELLRRNAEQAQTLETMLGSDTPDVAKLSAQLTLLQTSCKACHARYRD